MSTKKTLRGLITTEQLEWMREIRELEQKLRDGRALTDWERHCAADWLGFAVGMIAGANWRGRGAPYRAIKNWKYANVCVMLLNRCNVNIKAAAVAAIGPGNANLATVQKYYRLLRAGKGTPMAVFDDEILEALNRLCHSGRK